MAAQMMQDPAPAAKEHPHDRPVTAGLRVPSAEESAPVHTAPVAPAGQDPPPAIWLLAAHGGAGVSTLAASWAPAGDCLGGWPGADAEPYTVVVCRTHAAGLDAGHVLLRQARAGMTGPARLVGLVTVADAPGRLPARLRHRLHVVQAAAPQSWHIPWIDAFRQAGALTRLPVWTPGDAIPPRRRRLDPLTDLHPDVAVTGDHVFSAVREIHAEQRA